MKNMSNYNNINSCIQEYEDETMGIEDKDTTNVKY